MTDLGDEGRVLLDLARDAHNPTHTDRIRVRGILAARLGAAAGLGAGAAMGAAAQAATTTTAGVAGGVGTASSGGAAAVATATGATLATKVVGVALAIVAATGSGVAIHHARRAPASDATHVSSRAGHGPRRALALRTPSASTQDHDDDPAPASPAPDHPVPPAPVNRREPAARAGAASRRVPDETRAASPRPARTHKAAPTVAVEAASSGPDAPVKQKDGDSEGIPSSSAAAMTPPTKLDLTSESRLVHNGVVALRSGQPGLALAFFDAHALFFPQGSLAVERAAERVLALAALGRKKEARAAGEEFLRAHPTSPLALRIRKRLNALDPPPAPADPH